MCSFPPWPVAIMSAPRAMARASASRGNLSPWTSLPVANAPDPNAGTLATCTPQGRPSARIVLLKGVDHGFVFFTNYESRKARELAANPHAALCFFWPGSERQVRVEGTVEKVTAAESDE